MRLLSSRLIKATLTNFFFQRASFYSSVVTEMLPTGFGSSIFSAPLDEQQWGQERGVRPLPGSVALPSLPSRVIAPLPADGAPQLCDACEHLPLPHKPSSFLVSSLASVSLISPNSYFSADDRWILSLSCFSGPTSMMCIN